MANIYRRERENAPLLQMRGKGVLSRERERTTRRGGERSTTSESLAPSSISLRVSLRLSPSLPLPPSLPLSLSLSPPLSLAAGGAGRPRQRTRARRPQLLRGESARQGEGGGATVVTRTLKQHRRRATTGGCGARSPAQGRAARATTTGGDGQERGGGRVGRERAGRVSGPSFVRVKLIYPQLDSICKAIIKSDDVNYTLLL